MRELVAGAFLPPPRRHGLRLNPQGHARTVFRRALEHDNLVVAGATAKEIGRISLAEALELSLHMTLLGQDGLRATLSDVTVILGERRLQLTRAEARELHDQLVERNLAVLALQSELSRAMEADSARNEISADEEMRQELLLCLDAIEDELRLTDGLRGLRQAARVPITPPSEY